MLSEIGAAARRDTEVQEHSIVYIHSARAGLPQVYIGKTPESSAGRRQIQGKGLGSVLCCVFLRKDREGTAVYV